MSTKTLSTRSKVLLVCLAVALLVTAALVVRYRDVVFHDRGDIDSAGNQSAISILFIGNSMVFYGNVPGQLQAIAQENGVAITYKDISQNGASLSEQRDNAIREIKARNYDYVVLQDHAARPFNDVEGFLYDIQLLCEEARASGAIPVLYDPPWASVDGHPDEERLSVSTALYQQAAAENDAILVRAADAWVYAYQELPGISLYKRFDFHANEAGAYLTACVFAATLFEIQVQSVPAQKCYRGSDALNLAQAAWESTQLQLEH